MDLHAKYRHQFYQEQNIQLRKQVREIDLLLAQSTKKEEEGNTNSCVFLVLGPTGSGKTSLLQQFPYEIDRCSLPQTARKAGVAPVVAL